VIAYLRQRIQRHSWLLCLLLVATFLIRPALVQAGDLHSLKHGEFAVEQGVHDHSHDIDHGHDSDILHQFMHVTHSCSVLTALLFSPCLLLSPTPGLAPLVEPNSAFISASPEPDLRPPIAKSSVQAATA